VGPADKPRKLPAGRPVEPVSWRIRYAGPAAVVADLRSLGGPATQQGIYVRAWRPNKAWAQAYAPQLPQDEAHLLHLATSREEVSLEIDYVDDSGRRTTRVISELAQNGHLLKAWCDLRDDERVVSLRNVLAVRPA